MTIMACILENANLFRSVSMGKDTRRLLGSVQRRDVSSESLRLVVCAREAKEIYMVRQSVCCGAAFRLYGPMAFGLWLMSMH